MQIKLIGKQQYGNNNKPLSERLQLWQTSENNPSDGANKRWKIETKCFILYMCHEHF